jgi:hypothetical protein
VIIQKKGKIKKRLMRTRKIWRGIPWIVWDILLLENGSLF